MHINEYINLSAFNDYYAISMKIAVLVSIKYREKLVKLPVIR